MKEKLTPILGNLKDLLSEISKITNETIDTAVESGLNKILQDQPPHILTPEVREEIFNMFREHNSGQKIVPAFKYMNTFLKENTPKDIESIKNIRENFAQKLITDAKLRLKEKNTIDAQIVTEETYPSLEKTDRTSPHNAAPNTPHSIQEEHQSPKNGRRPDSRKRKKEE